VIFWRHFFRVLPRKPAPALAALYWHLTRRKVRACNRLRVESADLPFAYWEWIKANERTDELAASCSSVVENPRWRPRFCVLLHSHAHYSAEQLDRSRSSVECQVYPHWALNGPVDDDFNAVLSDNAADFVVPLRIGDELSSTALFRYAEAALAHRDACILFGDEDEIDEKGRRRRPWFKPKWNEELFFAVDYLSRCAAVDLALAKKACAGNQPNDVSAFMLAATAAANGAIVHVPHVLCHVHGRETLRDDRVDLVAVHLEPQGAKCAPGPFDTVKVQWPLPEELPLVSVMIPTRDKLHLLQPCIEGVLNRTDYPNVEILVVDNGSLEQSTSTYLADLGRDLRVRVLDFPHAFNFSAINNFAARQARGSFLCLLNNDTEVLEPGWLTELIRYAVRPQVGAVGAKLLYEDGTIQHAGIVIGIGEAAGHAHRFLPAGEPGYFRMAHAAQFVSAVTAACLVIDKSKFEAVGGFDEELAVAFNDVDFCLRVDAAGWRNVYVPHATLIHHESKSRGKDLSPEKVARFRGELETLQRRWGTRTYVDPVQNPNLDRCSETFIVRQ